MGQNNERNPMERFKKSIIKMDRSLQQLQIDQGQWLKEGHQMQSIYTDRKNYFSKYEVPYLKRGFNWKCYLKIDNLKGFWG